MKKSNSTIELKARIAETEIQQQNLRMLLKNDLHNFRESLKPINLIKNVIKKATGSAGVKSLLLDTSIGMTAGYLTRRVMVGRSRNILLKLAGSVLQFGISNFVRKNPKVIKSAGGHILKSIFKKKRQPETII
jgi:hypothetical protein